MRCCAFIHDDRLPATSSQTRQCTRRATWYVAHRDDRGVCAQHRRNTDTRPVPKEQP